MTASLDDEADRADGAPHPRLAQTLIGHADQERELLDAYRAGRLPHAIILGGPAGIGKATLAWRLARFILANPIVSTRTVQEAVDLGTPTDSKVAAQIASLSHPDVFLLRREINEKTKRFYTEIRADDVRRAIGLFQRAAGAGGYRICIVDSADDLNRSSANALLKLIEEPPPKCLFLLVAHRPGLILPTLRSRSRLIRLRSLTPTEIGDVIGAWPDAPPPTEVAAAAARADGSVLEALRHLRDDQTDLGTLLDGLLDRLPDLDWRNLHKLAEKVAGRDGEAAFEVTMVSVYDWIGRSIHAGADGPSSRLAPYAEVWEKVAAQARETDALNLDKRPLILTIFSDLAAAGRASSA